MEYLQRDPDRHSKDRPPTPFVGCGVLALLQIGPECDRCPLGFPHGGLESLGLDDLDGL